MKIIIENVNTNSIDYLNDVLGICGLSQCHESCTDSLTKHYVDLEKYPLDEYGKKHFFRMCAEGFDYGFRIYLSED